MVQFIVEEAELAKESVEQEIQFLREDLRNLSWFLDLMNKPISEVPEGLVERIRGYALGSGFIPEERKRDGLLELVHELYVDYGPDTTERETVVCSPQVVF